MGLPKEDYLEICCLDTALVFGLYVTCFWTLLGGEGVLSSRSFGPIGGDVLSPKTPYLSL